MRAAKSLTNIKVGEHMCLCYPLPSTNINVFSIELILDGKSEIDAHCARKELSMLFDLFKAFA